ncbi:MAG: hypothetical protein LBE83_04850, partial [Propionibacteriaceae bacterium]|nr:hypothetical protein [Propionibacteriaceae bacterium]
MTEQIPDPQAEVATVVSRVVTGGVKKVWAAILSPDGQTALLGEGATFGSKGDRWQAADGTWGVTRTFHPLEEIRFSWHKDDDAPKTWVEVTLEAVSSQETKVQIKHDHAGVDFDVPRMTARWKAALERIEHDTEH